MISGSSRFLFASCAGTMPVRVAPPGSSTLTVTGVSRKSAAMIRDSASAPAREGPYGTKPARVIVDWLTEMFTMRPRPAASIRGVTSRATRK
jgi:hypothetical protein